MEKPEQDPDAKKTETTKSPKKPKRKALGWDHGYIRRSRGRNTYYIREQRSGKRYEVSTKASTEKVAEAEYGQWSKNPEAYVPGRVSWASTRERPPLLFTQELVNEFLAHGSEINGNVGHTVTNKRGALRFWLKHFAGQDLRQISLSAMATKVTGKPQEQRRRSVMKTFCTWLRSEDRPAETRLTALDDPTENLNVPQYDETKRKQQNKAVDWEVVEKVRDELKGLHRDLMTLAMAVGWHVTEMHRFARGLGTMKPYKGAQAGEWVLEVKHKEGQWHRTAVDAEVGEAAKRILAHGTFDKRRYTKAVQATCQKLGVEAFGGGQMRHNVAHHLMHDLGVDARTGSTFLGHRSTATFNRFYATHSVPLNPALIPTTRKA